MSKANDQYHADVSRVSNSMLSCLKESPRKFYNRYELGQQVPATEAMLFGELVHCMVLEPDEVSKRFAIIPICDGRTKEGKAIREAFRTTFTNHKHIEKSMWDLAKACASNVSQHDELRWWLNKGSVEQRIDFEVDGIPCKCKPDLVCLEQGLIWDLKTTQNSSPRAFSSSVVDFGYHRQAALYRHAVEQVHGVQCRFLFAVVSKNEPFEAAVYELDDYATNVGMDEVRMLLRELELRRLENNWDSVWSTGVVPLSLPKWYRSNFFEVSEV